MLCYCSSPLIVFILRFRRKCKILIRIKAPYAKEFSIHKHIHLFIQQHCYRIIYEAENVMISVFITIFYHILNKCTFYHDFYCPVVTFDLPLPTNELCVTPHDRKIDGQKNPCKYAAKTSQKKKKGKKDSVFHSSPSYHL